MNPIRKQRGQAMVLTVLFSAGLLGMAALVLDVGSWMRAQRDLQAVADAAALAGAQALPEDSGTAAALAAEYTTKNSSLAGSPEVSFPDGSTIRVRVERDAPGVFARLFSIDSVNVSAAATARSQNPSEARFTAPIAVDKAHPMLACSPLPCFNEPTEIDMEKVGPGAFRLLNLDGSKGGTGQKTLAEWMLRGYGGWMPLGQYFSDPGAKFNPHEVQEALEARFGTEMLFPVYRTIREEGANLEYEVIGWVGFVPTGVKLKGNKGTVYGYFTRVVWEGLQGSSGNPDYGVRSIELVE